MEKLASNSFKKHSIKSVQSPFFKIIINKLHSIQWPGYFLCYDLPHLRNIKVHYQRKWDLTLDKTCRTTLVVRNPYLLCDPRDLPTLSLCFRLRFRASSCYYGYCHLSLDCEPCHWTPLRDLDENPSKIQDDKFVIHRFADVCRTI